ncbi:MAG: hypothetical protein ACD_21C00090G0007 [uncultured bacterium]|nr:MAG: hypothetical protein ACD_21C00090G0007 [uncultured bacterium]
MLTTVIMVISIFVQFVMAIIAIFLLRYAERHWSLFVIAISTSLMVIRRLVAFYFVFTGIQAPGLAQFNESASLILAVLLLIGVIGIVPIFSSIKLSEKKLHETESKLTSMIDVDVDWKYWMKPDGSFLYVSPAAERITGYSADEFMANPKLLLEIVHPDDLSRVNEHVRHLDAEECPDIDFRIITKFGDVRWVAHSCKSLFDDYGVWLGRSANNRDITEEKKEEAAAKRQMEFEHLVARISRNFAELKSLDINEGIRDAMMELGKLVGFDSSHVILIDPEAKIKECISEWKKSGVQSSFKWPQKVSLDFFQAIDRVFEYEQVLYIQDVNGLNDEWIEEKKVWAQGNIRANVCIPLKVRSKYMGYICFEWCSPKSCCSSDISLFKTIGEIIAVSLERKAIEEGLERAAKIDALTELPNRYQFGVIINQMLAYSIRHKLVLAVLSIDIDNFKDVNDAYGHAVGDMLLKEFGRRSKANIRAEDFIARMGGDEFIVVVFGLKEAMEVEVVARKLVEVVQKEYGLDGRTINISISMGIACYPIDGQDQQTLLKNADIAMYKAKELGKNNYQFFTKELRDKRQEQLNLEREMQVALDKKEFFLVYQPQFNENKEIIGMEALLRWHHPVRGLLLPGSYIVIAESSGLIVPLGKWILETASRQFNEWRALGCVEKINMSINLSFRQIEENKLEVDRDFFDVVKDSHEKNGHFELELTETSLMKNPELTKKVLNSLHDGGFGIAIDDFGTGYSSLQYLKYLPVQRIKIDRSFVAGIGTKADDEVIVETTILLSKKLGFAVIAEGVETEAQFEFLKKCGCKQFQGYYFSWPLEADDMLALLKKQAKKI